ncbi:MAG: mannosyltransferase [Microbacteriaceae bacterium]|nr:mannosyltransferase [Microbacteriaceae bacterium]MDQ1609549.1 mannosyltransferase [Microbacteriaceae bacterium]
MVSQVDVPTRISGAIPRGIHSFVIGRRARLAVAVGALGAGVSVLGDWVPSYWSDEVATLQAARLGWPDLFKLLRTKDAVHGLYYCLMHVWIAVFGESELATRSLSAIAVGLAAAGLVVLGFLLHRAQTGVLAGIIFCVLPRTTFMGSEARSYALGAAIAVWAFVALLVAATRRAWGWWSLYTALMVLGTYMFLYNALLLVAHGVYLLLTRREPRILLSWLVAAALACVTSAPLVQLSIGQKEQIAWLSDQPVVNVWTIVVEPWFESSWLVAAIAWAAIAALAFRFKRMARPSAFNAFVLAGAWAFVPLALLLSADAVAGPLYTSRYLSFTAPGLALLLALAVVSFKRWIGGSILVALIVAAAPTYIAQRQPFAKNGGSDLREIAETVASHASPGDAFFLQNDGPVTLRPRLAFNAYPSLFASLDDVALIRSDLTKGHYADVTFTPDELPYRVANTHAVWVVTSTQGSHDATEIGVVLGNRGLHEVATYRLNRDTVSKYSR